MILSNVTIIGISNSQLKRDLLTLGNKCDLVEGKEVTSETGAALASGDNTVKLYVARTESQYFLR